MDTFDFEGQYADALRRILDEGVRSVNRTGTDTLAIHHQYIYIRDVDTRFPILNGKKMFPKMALKEVLWMLMGRTDTEWLNERGVTYWDEWATVPHGSLHTIGRSYGCQFRDFNGYDQLKKLLKDMREDPVSRRLIISLWNASDLPYMALPPCMYDYHFECTPVTGGYQVYLHAKLRSNDAFLGAPYDFMFCAWLLRVICGYLNATGTDVYTPADIFYTADNFHMYVNHKEQVEEYLGNVDADIDGCIGYKRQAYLPAPGRDDGITDIDSYLAFIDAHMKDVHVDKNAKHEYRAIQAPIAV